MENKDMNDFKIYQRTTEGKKSIRKLSNNIKTKSIKNRSLMFEWLVLRSIYMLNLTNQDPRDIYNGKLDSNFSPLNIAPSSEPDFEMKFFDKSIAIEATLRPISGYIEHFSHLKNKDFGLFFFLTNYSNLPPEVWETFSNNFKRFDDLFIPISFQKTFEFADKENSKQRFRKFIKKSRKYFERNEDWKSLKIKFVNL